MRHVRTQPRTWEKERKKKGRDSGHSGHQKFVHAYLNSVIPTKFVHVKDCRSDELEATMYGMYKFHMYQVPYS